MTQQESPPMRGPGGPATKRQPSAEGLGVNPEENPSAGGAALNRPLSPSSSRAKRISISSTFGRLRFLDSLFRLCRFLQRCIDRPRNLQICYALGHSLADSLPDALYGLLFLLFFVSHWFFRALSTPDCDYSLRV